MLVRIVEERLGGVSLVTGGAPVLIILDIEVGGELSLKLSLIGGGGGGSDGLLHGYIIAENHGIDKIFLRVCEVFFCSTENVPQLQI